jgi:hypothetical protein
MLKNHFLVKNLEIFHSYKSEEKAKKAYEKKLNSQKSNF